MIMMLFCFAAMFNHLNTINLNLLKVKGRSDLYLKLEIYKKIVATLILFAAIPFGVIAICISKIVYTQVAILFNTYYSGKFYNLGYFSQIKDFIPYLLSSIIACVPSFLLTFTNIPDVGQVLIGIVSAFGLYYLLLRKDELFIEVIEMIKGKLLNVWT